MSIDKRGPVNIMLETLNMNDIEIEHERHRN